MHQANNRREHSCGSGRKVWDIISPKSHQLWGNPQEGTQNPELLPEEGRVWTPQQSPQLLRQVPERQAPKTFSFENQRCPKAHQVTEIWERTLKGLAVGSLTPGLRSWSGGVHIIVNEAPLLNLPEGQSWNSVHLRDLLAVGRHLQSSC